MMSLPLLKPLDSTNNIKKRIDLIDNNADQTSSRVLSANAVIVSRRKKKSHLSRDELARVCNEGEVAFEPYNGSTYMVAVRSLGDRKSLIGYRCDWHSCGYMNARVERMFGHIRSQHPEAPAVKKLISTTATNNSTTTTTLTAASNIAAGSETTTTTGVTSSARLSIRSSSSLSSSSSSSSSNSSMLTYSPNDNHHNLPQHQQQSSINNCQTPVESCPASPQMVEDQPTKLLATSKGAESQQEHILNLHSAPQSTNLVGDTTYLEPNDLSKACGNNRLIDLLKCETSTSSETIQQQAQPPTTAEQIMAELKTISSPSSSTQTSTTTSSAPLLAVNTYGPIDRNNNLHHQGGAAATSTLTAQNVLVQESSSNNSVATPHDDDDILDLESLLSSDNTSTTPSDPFASQLQSYPPNALSMQMCFILITSI